jgi:UDP-glucose-4-epimerase GalE
VSTVLVTGGAGYVGSHAAKALAAVGYDVVVYDDLSAGHREAVEAIARTYPARRISLVEGDIADGARVLETLRASSAEAVMHFAARLLVGESVRQPVPYYRVNVVGALTVLGAMVGAGVSRFIFSSTAATFGEPERVPIDEAHPQRPINAYGETKLAIERALPHLERAHGIRWVALRYFNASGADEDGLIGEDHDPEEHLIPRALLAAQGGPPLTIFGDDYDTPDGTCIRDFVHVSDLADAHLLALASLDKDNASSAYNLGNGDGRSVREVVDAVRAATGREVPHTVGPRRPGDPARLVASSAKARRDLGWAPRRDRLETIIGTAWRWHEQHPRGYASLSTGAT